MNYKTAFLVLVTVFFNAVAALAQEGNLPIRPEPNASSGWAVDLPQGSSYNPRTNPNPAWGTTASSIKQIHAYQFVPIDSSVTYAFDGASAMRYRTGGSNWFEASLSLPSGVSILGLEVYACDNHAGGDLHAFLFVSTGPSTVSTYGGQMTSGTPGCGYYWYDLGAAGLITDNASKDYSIEIALPVTGSNFKFRSVNVYCRLNVSPAPASATFADVPTSHPYFQYVEALAASGITGGCGGGNFCPNNPLTRGQMAVFLSKALGLHFPY